MKTRSFKIFSVLVSLFLLVTAAFVPSSAVSEKERLNSEIKKLQQQQKEQQEEMADMEEHLREKHMRRLNKKQCSPEFSVVYTDIVNDLKKIGDNCDNIANAVLKDINFRAIKDDGEKHS